MLRKLTAKKLGLVGVAVVAVLALTLPVTADGADVTQFKSDGAGASTNLYIPGDSPGEYTTLLAQATESNSGSDRQVYVYVRKIVRVANDTNTGWAYRYVYSYGVAPDASVFSVSKSQASLKIDPDTLPGQYDYSYQIGTNPPPIPAIDLSEVDLKWAANSQYTYMNTGHNVRRQVVSTTGTTIKRVQSGMQTQSSADVSGTFCGDYEAPGTINDNKNLTIQVTKE